MPSCTLTQNDYGKYIDIYLYDEDEYGNTTPVTITAASINIYWRKSGESTNSVSGTCEIVTGTLGYCRYLIGTTDTARNGRFNAEVEVNFSGGAVSTWHDIDIFIRPELG